MSEITFWIAFTLIGCGVILGKQAVRDVLFLLGLRSKSAAPASSRRMSWLEHYRRFKIVLRGSRALEAAAEIQDETKKAYSDGRRDQAREARKERRQEPPS